ncbi:MAG: Ig domain-containing protein [Acidimicrobiales bacterium]
MKSSYGGAPYSWWVIKGSLPAGLSLHPTSGTIIGTPKRVGRATFTVRVTDAAGTRASAALACIISATAAE